jgi:hypothetical protein
LGKKKSNIYNSKKKGKTFIRPKLGPKPKGLKALQASHIPPLG